MFELKLLKRIDWLTIIIVLALVGFGLVSIASIMATPFDGGEQGLSDYLAKLNWNYVEKQAVNFLVGLAVFLILLVLDYQLYKIIIKYAYIALIILLLALFLAERTRGMQGWFMFEAIDRALQPGELCKIGLIIFLAKVVSDSMNKHGKLKTFKSVLYTVAICAVPTALVMLQPDFGTAFVYICIWMFVIFTAKISWGYIATIVGMFSIALPASYLFIMSEEQQFRIKVFLNPELDLQKYGYNVMQSKLAIGSGELYGKGYFNSGTIAQLGYVPERHTDFIFAGIAEGIGFVGGTILIALYFILIFRWLYMAVKIKDNFGVCLIMGVMGMTLAHVFENVGMTIGLMPVTGIPLPFISYGGSNLLTNMIGVGIVQNVWMRRPMKK